MSDKDDTLKAMADYVDRVAAAHKDHDCPFEAAAAIVGGAVRHAMATSSGPAQVATEAYRTSWDRTFNGKPATRGQA